MVSLCFMVAIDCDRCFILRNKAEKAKSHVENKKKVISVFTLNIVIVKAVLLCLFVF